MTALRTGQPATPPATPPATEPVTAPATAPDVAAPPPSGSGRARPDGRGVGAFATASQRRRWWIVFALITLAAISAGIALVVWDNPMEPGTRGFWLIARRRAMALLAMGVVAVCQSTATIAFQTVTANRIVTPSIMGFESLYRAIHTATVFFLGVAGLHAARSTLAFVGRLGIMVALSLVLYSWLLTSRRASVHAMLLLGIVIGTGLGSVSSFMQRLLTPSEFDVLTARLFGSIANAEEEYYPVALPLALGGAAVLALLSRRLNVLSLGRDTATSLGLPHRRTSVLVLVVVSVLMATSTALVGPMTFLGFLVATLTYQLCPTFDHRYLFPMGVSLGFLILAGAYFTMKHVFNAQGVVSILIELVGGSIFILVILRRGRL